MFQSNEFGGGRQRKYIPNLLRHYEGDILERWLGVWEEEATSVDGRLLFDLLCINMASASYQFVFSIRPSTLFILVTFLKGTTDTTVSDF